MPTIHKPGKLSHCRYTAYLRIYALRFRMDPNHNHFSFSVSGDFFQLFEYLLSDPGHCQPKKKCLTRIAFPALKHPAKHLFYDTWPGITCYLPSSVASPCDRQQLFCLASGRLPKPPDKIQRLDKVWKMLIVLGARTRRENQDKYGFVGLYPCKKESGTIPAL